MFSSFMRRREFSGLLTFNVQPSTFNLAGNPQSKICDPKSTCQGGESNSRPRAYESPALPLSYPGAKERKLNASHSVSTRTDVNRSLFACRVGKVRLQVLFGTTQCGHEAHPAMLAHCADPAFLMNVAPSGKRQHRAGFRIPLRRKKK